MARSHAVATRGEAPVSWAVLGQTLVVLSDAHVGAAPDEVEEALMAFLDLVPSLGDCLLVNGDLFQFWFSYRRVVPRRGFPVAARLATLARTLPIAFVGGNHDRWGDRFWAGQPGMLFGRRQLRFEIGSRRVLAVHGDGLGPQPGIRPYLHRAIGSPITSALYRLVHPDLGMWLANAAAPLLGGAPADPAGRAAKAARQQAWAEGTLEAERSVDLLVMGHTHVPALHRRADGREYLNPGAWIDGLCFAVSGADGSVLRQYPGS